MTGEPLTGSTILNPDSQNADIENADIENADPQNADIENNEIDNADIENADIENADIENADIENADIENADIENADIENADIENADIENADIENADIENADIENADIENGAVSDYSVDLKNHGNTATTYQVKVRVTGDTDAVSVPVDRPPCLQDPDSRRLRAQGSRAQPDSLQRQSDRGGSRRPGRCRIRSIPRRPTRPYWSRPANTSNSTLRAWDKDALTGAGAPPNDGIQPFCPMLSTSPTGLCQSVTNQVTITVASVSSNTGSNTPPITTFPSTPTPVPFTLIVTNTNDSGPGSLRQAMINANTHTGFTDTISFSIRGTGSTIAPASPLPQLTEPVIIDGTTQPGYAGTPLIELNGAEAGAGPGLSLASTASGSTVRGLAINRFGGNGIAAFGNGT